MKIEIDTDKDSYKVWLKAQKLIELLYNEPRRPLKPDNKESDTIKLRRGGV